MASPVTAFKAITTRVAYHATTALAPYEGAQWSATGKLEKADGTRPFAGIVEYGTDIADGVVTVVRGIFPAKAGVANIAVGDAVTFANGALVTATTAALGIAVSAGTEVGDLVGVAIYESPVPVQP